MSSYLKVSLLALCSIAGSNIYAMDFDERKEDQMDSSSEPAASHRSSFERLASPPPHYFSLHQQQESSAASKNVGRFEKARVYSTPLTPNLIDTALSNCPAEISDIIATLEITKNNLNHPARPKKLLFVGPPGTGKTTLAHIIADKSGMPCYAYKSSLIANEFKNSGDKNLEALFLEIMKKNTPCVVLMDELQVLIKKDAQNLNSDTSMLTTLWSLLDESEKYPILMIGAFNYVESMPEQLLDRQDEVIKVNLPDKYQREQSLIYLVGTYKGAIPPVDFSHLSLPDLAKKTDGKSHRKLTKMIAKAVRSSMKRDSIVTIKDCLVAQNIIGESQQKTQDPSRNTWKYWLLKHGMPVLNYGMQAAAIAIPLYFNVKQEARAARQESAQNDMNLFSQNQAIVQASGVRVRTMGSYIGADRLPVANCESGANTLARLRDQKVAFQPIK